MFMTHKTTSIESDHNIVFLFTTLQPLHGTLGDLRRLKHWIVRVFFASSQKYGKP
jgi:hypothetical protein